MASDLKSETRLMLGPGHCLREQVLEACPELESLSVASWMPESGMRRTFEGSSLETIRHMVASGIGVTVLPRTSIPSPMPRDSLLRYLPFEDPVPGRRVVLAWRKTFPRPPAIEMLRRAILSCILAGLTKLELDAFVS